MRRFEKYHGLGNDFLLIERGQWRELIEQRSWPEQVAALCDRHRGVGADGVIVCAPRGEAGEVEMAIFNRDGSRPQMCGNGVRCVAAWADRRGLLKAGASLIVQSDAGPRRCELLKDERAQALTVRVEMGRARLGAEARQVTLAGQSLALWEVDMGNPHAVSLDGPLNEALIDAIGQQANASPQLFAHGVNLEVVERISARRYGVVVYERGVGRTQACGTGACAVAAALWRRGDVPAEEAIEVELPGGALQVEQGEEGVILMSGPAEHVFCGEWAPF